MLSHAVMRCAALLPEAGLQRRLVIQSLIYSIGSGVFVAGNIVFFTGYAGFTAGQVGVAMSSALAVSVITSVPAGKLADRVGPLRTWAATALLEGVLYLTYPLIGSFPIFIGVLCILALSESAGNAGRTAYTLGALPRETRVRTLAYIRSYVNLGFTMGAGACGVLLAVASGAWLAALPLAAGFLLLVNGLFIGRLPTARTSRLPSHATRKRSNALRNGSFVRLAILNGVLSLHDTLLSVVMPLWIVTATDAPKAMVAVAFIVNTALVVVLQVPMSRGADTVSGAARAERRAGLALATACLAMVATFYASGIVTLGILLVGYLLLTFGELQQSAGGWGLFAELAPEHERGDYQGVWRLGAKSVHVGAPAVLSLLAIQLAPAGWLIIAAVLVAAALAAPGAARAADRRRPTYDAAGSPLTQQLSDPGCGRG